ncbi:hypothetical protein, partial [Enterococcus faecium]|uniref:hypothetical protein n=1 Tax=Enterococcus faecium TaxID=1352 RepID=UPI0030C7E515
TQTIFLTKEIPNLKVNKTVTILLLLFFIFISSLFMSVLKILAKNKITKIIKIELIPAFIFITKKQRHSTFRACSLFFKQKTIL